MFDTNKGLKKVSFALILAVVLTLSVFSVSALEDGGVASNDAVGATIDASLLTDDGAAAKILTNETPADGDVASVQTLDLGEEGLEIKGGDTSSETVSTEPTQATGADENVPANGITDIAVDADKEEESKFGLPDIISLAVLGVVIILIVIYCLTHKEKTGKFFRGLKSEFKKISWTPWNQVRKNTLVVLVVVIAVAIVIGIADFAFNRGIEAIGKMF